MGWYALGAARVANSLRRRSISQAAGITLSQSEGYKIRNLSVHNENPPKLKMKVRLSEDEVTPCQDKTRDPPIWI